MNIENENERGYCITTTPGLISEGTRALGAWELTERWGAPGIVLGLHDEERGLTAIATWATREAAEAVMLAITPSGMSPAVYAGLRVEPVWSAAPVEACYGLVVRQISP